jgi:RNA polymerase sigma factor (sigma-70 family)
MEVAQLPRLLSRTAASLSSASDDELIAEIIVGSNAAFEVLYQRHSPGMLAMARQLLDSPTEAEDAVQHAFLASYRELESGVTPTYPRAWLYAIARNRCLTLIRDRREVAAEVAEPSTVGLAEEVERRSDLRDLLRDMRRLPEEQRTALALFEMGGLTQAEIAKVMRIDTGRVKALVFQARSNLIHARAASDATCSSVRSQLSTLRGGRLNTRELRNHVRDCEGCAEYAIAVREQRRRLAIVLPVVPLMAALKAPLVGGAAIGTVGAKAGGVVGSVGRKVAWLRPRPSVIAALAATGVASAAAVAAVATGGGDDPKPREPVARPAAVAPAPPPAAKPAVVAKQTSKPAARKQKAKKKKAAKATPVAAAPAPAVEPATAPEPEPVAAPQTPAPAPVSAPAPQASPPPAAPAEPPGQDFDLGDPGPPAPGPETPASEP